MYAKFFLLNKNAIKFNKITSLVPLSLSYLFKSGYQLIQSNVEILFLWS